MRILLLPLSLLYGIFTGIYHLLYDIGLCRAHQFGTAVISVGNLSTGGTGKTPLVEYIVRLLMPDYRKKIAILSRGYGRVTRGFLFADETSSFFRVGDEPRQYRQKFSNVLVAVDGDRVRGIRRLLRREEAPEVIILDDAFQHRRVKAGLNILLMDYHRLPAHDHLLPAGNLREWPSGAKRADLIVITHAPAILSPHERRRIQHLLKPRKEQHIHFAFLQYGDFVPLHKTGSGLLGIDKKYYLERNFHILLVTGIANPSPLAEHLRSAAFTVAAHLRFPDHHPYRLSDVRLICEKFNTIAHANKLVVTSEKDAMRLSLPGLLEALRGIPVFYMPVKTEFHRGDGEAFNQKIRLYVEKNKRSRRIHRR